MRDLPKSTIAQVLFGPTSRLNFAHVVGELDKALDARSNRGHSLTWDCDDLAIFDLPDARIILSYTDGLLREFAACLTVAVGPNPSAVATDAGDGRNATLCKVIAGRVRAYYGAVALRWHETGATVTPDLVDDLLDDLDGPADAAAPAAQATAPATPEGAVPPPAAANLPAVLAEPPDTAGEELDRLHRVRSALYTIDEDKPAPATKQMRLAVHAMNATLIVVSLPVGAALMTYSLMRGEDLRLSSRAMALTGTVLCLLQTPLLRDLPGGIV